MKDGNELWRELELVVNCICGLTGEVGCICPLVRYCFDLMVGPASSLVEVTNGQ